MTTNHTIPKPESFQMDQQQLDWVDGRLNRLETTTVDHAVVVAQVKELIPELRRLTKLSYIALGVVLAISILDHWHGLASLAVESITR